MGTGRFLLVVLALSLIFGAFFIAYRLVTYGSVVSEDALDRIAQLESELSATDRALEDARDELASSGARFPGWVYVVMIFVAAALSYAVIAQGGRFSGRFDAKQCKEFASRVMVDERGWRFFRDPLAVGDLVYHKVFYHPCQAVNGLDSGYWGIVEFVRDTGFGRPLPGSTVCVIVKLDDPFAQYSTFFGTHDMARDYLLSRKFQQSLSSRGIEDLFSDTSKVVDIVENAQRLRQLEEGV